MIKNRLVTGSNRVDRFLRSSSLTSSGNMNELWEEDLWPYIDTEEADPEAVQNFKENNCNQGKLVIHSTGIRGSPWIIPRIGGSDTGLRHHHQSAPVNVPDWSKILGINYRKEQNPYAVDVDMAGDEEEEAERLPPHEYLAREHARSRIFTTSSVMQGVGLKGRDLSRIRNAVWRQTGFLE